MSFQCKFCKNNFTSGSILTHHQKTAKYCLKLQDKKSKFVCICGKKLCSNFSLQKHQKICKFMKVYTHIIYSKIIKSIQIEKFWLHLSQGVERAKDRTKKAGLER